MAVRLVEVYSLAVKIGLGGNHYTRVTELFRDANDGRSSFKKSQYGGWLIVPYAALCPCKTFVPDPRYSDYLLSKGLIKDLDLEITNHFITSISQMYEENKEMVEFLGEMNNSEIKKIFKINAFNGNHRATHRIFEKWQ